MLLDDDNQPTSPLLILLNGDGASMSRICDLCTLAYSLPQIPRCELTPLVCKHAPRRLDHVIICELCLSCTDIPLCPLTPIGLDG
jgi:hypothetical protein